MDRKIDLYEEKQISGDQLNAFVKSMSFGQLKKKKHIKIWNRWCDLRNKIEKERQELERREKEKKEKQEHERLQIEDLGQEFCENDYQEKEKNSYRQVTDMSDYELENLIDKMYENPELYSGIAVNGHQFVYLLTKQVEKFEKNKDFCRIVENWVKEAVYSQQYLEYYFVPIIEKENYELMFSKKIQEKDLNCEILNCLNSLIVRVVGDENFEERIRQIGAKKELNKNIRALTRIENFFIDQLDETEYDRFMLAIDGNFGIKIVVSNPVMCSSIDLFIYKKVCEFVESEINKYFDDEFLAQIIDESKKECENPNAFILKIIQYLDGKNVKRSLYIKIICMLLSFKILPERDENGEIVSACTIDEMSSIVGVFLENYIKIKEKKETYLQKYLHKDTVLVTINDIDIMTGIEFERFICGLFKKMGYQSIQTKISGDQGVDVIATKGEKIVAIQTKCQKAKVGNSAVQEVVAGKVMYNANECMVVTNSFFTQSAVELARQNEVILWDRKELIKRIEELDISK